MLFVSKPLQSVPAVASKEQFSKRKERCVVTALLPFLEALALGTVSVVQGPASGPRLGQAELS